MGTTEITVDNLQIDIIPKYPDRSPKCSLTASGKFANLLSFRVAVTIIGFKPKKPKRYLSLSDSESEDILQAVTNIVILLYEKAIGKESAG